MRKFGYIFTFFVLVLIGCKSEFEALRTSNDPEKVFKAANNYYTEKEYDRAIALYDVVIQFYRGRQESEQLFYNYAYAHYYKGDFILASSYFKNFATTFTNSPFKEEADYMAAYSNYKLSPNYKLDQSYTAKAIQGLEQFINQYPGTDRAENANKLIDEMRKKLEIKSFEQGNLYYKIGQYQAAMVSFQNTLKDFPETSNGESIRFLILKSSHILAINSIYEKKIDRLEETLGHYEAFNKKHPRSKNIKDAKDIQKEVLREIKTLKS